MSITEKLTSSKNALASLLDYANAKTEKNDPDIGEAIRTLVDGYGGGGIPNVRHITFVPDTDITSSNRYTLHTDPFSADHIIIIVAREYPEINPAHYGLIYFWTMRRLTSIWYASPILRPNGTIGNDGGRINCQPADGTITLGWDYATMYAGQAYDIYLIEV